MTPTAVHATMVLMPRKGYRATHCKRGHAFTDDNIVWIKGRHGEPARTCRQCVIDNTRKKRGSKASGPSQRLKLEQRLERQRETGLKRCGRCHVDKPFAAFKDHEKTPDGLYGWCRACCSERYRERSTPETRAQAARRIRDRAWGLAEGEYDTLLRAQGGGCAICSSTCSSGRSLAVDHDHLTGAIRGLLCAHCNRAIGMLGESPLRLRTAAAYLEGHAYEALS